LRQIGTPLYMGVTHVELPSLHVLARLFASYDNHELGDLTPVHPLLQLAHDLLDVGFDLIISGHCTR
jgi:hypothetical protein